MVKNKILIIDDDEDFLEATAALLKAKGYLPICAANGQDGFQLAKTEAPDMIFLDMVMAYDDEGARIAEAMASDGSLREIPVVLVTGMKQKMEVTARAGDLPVKAVLDKPVSPHELLKTVRTYMLSSGLAHRRIVDEITKIVKKWEGKQGSLVMILHSIQNHYGYIPRGVSFILTGLLSMPLARIYEVITFYNFFKLEEPGKYTIAVCMGTACYLKGADKLLEELKKELGVKEGETTPDGLFQLEVVRCLGCCGLAPVMTINGKVFGKITPKDIKTIVESYRKQ